MEHADTAGNITSPNPPPMGSKPSYSLAIPDISQIPDISRRRYQINHQTHDESPRNGCHERACGHPPLASSGGRGGLTSGAGSITEEASRVCGSASALQSGVSAHKSHNGDSPRPKPARNRG